MPRTKKSRRKRRNIAAVSGGGKIADIVPPLEPLQERGRLSRFLRDDSGEPSDKILAVAKLLAAAGTAFNPATAPLNEETIKQIEGQLLSKGFTRDEIDRQEQERRLQPQGSALGPLGFVEAPPAPGGVNAIVTQRGALPQLQLQGQPQPQNLIAPSLAGANVPGGGTQPLPFPQVRQGGLTLPPNSPFVGTTFNKDFLRAPNRFGRVLRP